MEFSQDDDAAAAAEVRAALFRCGRLLHPPRPRPPGGRVAAAASAAEGGEEAFYARVRGLSYASALRRAAGAARSGAIRDLDFASDLVAKALRNTLQNAYGGGRAGARGAKTSGATGGGVRYGSGGGGEAVRPRQRARVRRAADRLST